MTVVVLRALGLGDLLTGLPALRGLRAHLADQRIVLAAPAWLEPVATLSGAVDAVVPTRPLGPVRVRRPRLAVNLHGRGPESTATLRATDPLRLWAFDAPGGPRWDAAEGEHEVTRWCRFLAAYGVPCDAADLDLPVPDVAPAGTGLTVVHPGGAAPARRWPPRRWAAGAAGLTAAGHRVVVTGSRAEIALATQVAAGAGLSPADVLAGANLLTLCATVARARMVVSADTGVAHLATAYRTPSVAPFGPVGPAEWGPPPDQPQHACRWADRSGDPYAAGPDPGLLSFTPDDILAAASLDGKLDDRRMVVRGHGGCRPIDGHLSRPCPDPAPATACRCP